MVSSYFRPHVGGVERFVELLASSLAGRGHTVTVLACRTSEDPPLELVDGYEIRRVRASNILEQRLGIPYPLPMPGEARRALDALLARADVAHVHEARYVLSAAVIRRGAARAVPVLLTQHTGFVPQRHAVFDAVERLVTRAVGSSARRVSLTAVYNPDVAAWAAKEWGLTAVDVLPVGVAPPAEPARRSAFGLPEGRFVVLFVGRNVPTKGLDSLLGALGDEYVVAAVTDARLDARPGLVTLPFMPADRLAQLMASVDAFVLPSRGEGVPLALQEAMSVGLPVLTTMLPGYERYFGSDDIIPIEPDPASIRQGLLALAHDEERRRHLARRSSEVARRHFSLKRFVDAYEETYERLAAGRPASRDRSAWRQESAGGQEDERGSHWDDVAQVGRHGHRRREGDDEAR